jgi:cell division septation protein DedD
MKSGPGSLQWIALFAAGAVIMVLTFTLGVLVGRQWSRPAPAIASIESGARRTVPPGKRGGLSGADVEPPPPIDQKLTFYQTLTAPLGRGSADASQRAEDKAKAQPAPEPARAKPSPPPDPYTSRGETIIESPAPPEATTASAPAPSQADTAGLLSVQVAAFKTQAQADTLQKQLKQAGFDAYVASAAAADGQTNYRVRVGTFKSKPAAQRMVERVRGERSLAAFVTPR